MSRKYIIPLDAISVGAAMDLIGVQVAEGKAAKVLEFWIDESDATLSTACDLRMAMCFIQAVGTAASGGTTNPPVPLDPGDSPSQCTSWQKCPTGVVGSVIVDIPYSCHIYQGKRVNFIEEFGEGLHFQSSSATSQAWVLKLLQAPAAACTLSGGMLIEESGI